MPDPRLEHARFQPDIAVGRHPEFGICAANPRELPAGQWMLERLGFRPVPGSAVLYALTDQSRDGQARAAQAVATLRQAGYTVDADAPFDPAPSSSAVRLHDRPQRADPDVAFAEHPQLGVVAATASTMNAVERGGQVLEDHGWRFNHQLDIYTLPVTVDRDEALGRLAQATTAMHRAGDLQVAVQPQLAEAAAARRAPAPAAPARHDPSQSFTTHKFPVTAVALATSPARAGLPGKPPIPAPSGSAPAARPVDPRIAFSRNR